MDSVDPFASPASAAVLDRPAVPAPAEGEPSLPASAAEQPAAAEATDVSSGRGRGEGSARTRGIASGGAPVSVPDRPGQPVWPGGESADEQYVPDEAFDASDLHLVNRELNRCRARLFRVSGALRAAQRAAAEADLQYRRELRRALVTVSGGTAESRKAVAELQCEPFENEQVIAQQVVEEWKKRAMDARDDLKAVENLSHNVRAQMDIR
jgi:hypothetical protein